MSKQKYALKKHEHNIYLIISLIIFFGLMIYIFAIGIHLENKITALEEKVFGEEYYWGSYGDRSEDNTDKSMYEDYTINNEIFNKRLENIYSKNYDVENIYYIEDGFEVYESYLRTGSEWYLREKRMIKIMDGEE